MKLHSVIKFIVPAVLLLLVAGLSQAATINGSLSLNGGGLTQNGANLSVSTQITATTMATLSAGIGDYLTPVPISTNFGASILDITALQNYTFTSAVFGTFHALNDPTNIVVQRTASFMDVFLIGTFTPGTSAAWAGFTPTRSSLRFSINQSGGSISEAITLNSPDLPPPGTPEPATMALMGSALVGLGLIGRKRIHR